MTEEDGTGLDLTRVLQLMADHGVSRILVKRLSANDNSKNQVYAGSGFAALNIFPNGGIEEAPWMAGSVRKRFYAPVNFSWLLPNGALAPAPYTQLILYPKYPEVRLSGFLSNSPSAPNDIMRRREPGRVLFIGIREGDGGLIGHVDGSASVLRRQFDGLGNLPKVGAFRLITAAPTTKLVDWRQELLRELGRVAGAGWIEGKRLTRPRLTVPCNNQNCGGFTLEAELGIVANALAAPDYHGWELKAHGVNDLTRNTGGPITLMTPEPTGGYYGTHGFQPFMRKFGYPDISGKPDRINFGGIFKIGVRAPRTGLTMVLEGYDPATKQVDLAAGQLGLRTDAGVLALAYPIKQLLDHWSVKHALAAYVPYISSKNGVRSYQYGSSIRLGVGTDGLLFLKAIADGVIYYDPAPKLEEASTAKPREHRRSQLRVASGQVPTLYAKMTTVTVPP